MGAGHSRAGLEKETLTLRLTFRTPPSATGIADTLKLLANTPITQRNMATLTTLWASGASIRDITGLEFAVNLEALDLADNGITDVSPLLRTYKTSKNWIFLTTRLRIRHPLSVWETVERRLRA